MMGAPARLGGLARETVVCSALYLGAFFFTFQVWMPVQGAFFPRYGSYASLLFLPHGVRILTAWLLGWRATLALLPGVFAAFAYVAGVNVLYPSRLAAIVIAVSVAPAMFSLVARLGLDLAPRAGRAPCWICVMGVGVLASFVGAALTNLVLGNGPIDYFAYVIGDVSGLFFLMLILMLVFRWMRRTRR